MLIVAKAHGGPVDLAAALDPDAAAAVDQDVGDLVVCKKMLVFTGLFQPLMSVCGKLCGWRLEKAPFSASEIARILSCWVAPNSPTAPCAPRSQAREV
jgi:hypothetical protein